MGAVDVPAGWISIGLGFDGAFARVGRARAEDEPAAAL